MYNLIDWPSFFIGLGAGVLLSSIILSIIINIPYWK